MSERAPYNIAVGDWLHSMPWTHWATLTTPYELTMKGARRLAHRFHRRLNKDAPASMFWACEPFDAKDGFHLHALLNVPGVPYESIIQTYQDTAGGSGWKRIQLDEFNPSWKKKGKEEREDATGATYYVGKYITKKLSDYDLLLPKRSRKPKQLSIEGF